MPYGMGVAVPSPSANDKGLSRRGTLGILFRAGLIIVFLHEIVDTFVHVPGHIVESERVGGKRSDRGGGFVSVVLRGVLEISRAMGIAEICFCRVDL